MKHLALLIIVLPGCKAVEKYKASSAFPADCAAAFPVKRDTVFRPGITKEIPGPVLDCDSILAAYQAWERSRRAVIDGPRPSDTLHLDKFNPKPSVKVVCPPSRITIDTLAITAESTARLAACERAAAEALAQAAKDVSKLERAVKKSQAALERRTTQRNNLGKALTGVSVVTMLAIFGLLKSRR